MPAFDDEAAALADELAEVRVRLGVSDTAVFGPPGALQGGLRRLQAQARDGVATVREGVSFFSLGVRTLVADLGYAGRLFGRASLGNTLKPREVAVRGY